MKNYRSAFFVALAGNILLAGALGFFWWRSHAPGEQLKLRLRVAASRPLHFAGSPAARGDKHGTAAARATVVGGTGPRARPDFAATPAKYRREAWARAAQGYRGRNPYGGQCRRG